MGKWREGVRKSCYRLYLTGRSMNAGFDVQDGIEGEAKAGGGMKGGQLSFR